MRLWEAILWGHGDDDPFRFGEMTQAGHPVGPSAQHYARPGPGAGGNPSPPPPGLVLMHKIRPAWGPDSKFHGPKEFFYPHSLKAPRPWAFRAYAQI